MERQTGARSRVWRARPQPVFLDQVILPAGLVVRATDACSGKLSFLPNSRFNKARLMTACTATVATDRYQTARMENPGSRERTAAGVAKMRRRAAELPSDGRSCKADCHHGQEDGLHYASADAEACLRGRSEVANDPVD